MATFKPVVIGGKKHLKSDGTKNIKIRIYHNTTPPLYISTDFYIEEEYMGKDGTISNSYPDADLLNFELGDLIQKCRNVQIRSGTNRLARMSCAEVKEQIEAALEPEYEFIDFIDFHKL